jgi:transcriptional regulator CtsR
MHTVNTIGERIDTNTAAALLANLQHNDAVKDDEIKLIMSAIGTNALRPARPIERDALRASILKQMLMQTNLQR